MFSNLISFQQILERVKDDTGIDNVLNIQPKIRRLINRVEHDLGYGGSLILRRKRYSIVKGNIIFDGNIYKLKLPEDVVRLESVGMCAKGVCPSDYLIQGNWMFFCKGKAITELDLIYYTLLTDGEGNPMITHNHFEAVTAGIVYWLYKQGIFSNKSNANLMQYYEFYYHERLSEARGDDIMPTTMEEYSRAARILQMSSRDAFYYDLEKRCFCEIPVSEDELEESKVVTTGPGSGYTEPSVIPGGGGEGEGTGGSTDGDGGYLPPGEPDPDEPDEPINEDPTIDDITFYTTDGHTTVITWEMFVEGSPAPYNDPEGDLMDAVRFDGLKFDNKGKWFYQGGEIGVDVPFGTIAYKANFDNGELVYIAWDSEDYNHDILYFSVRDSANGNWVS